MSSAPAEWAARSIISDNSVIAGAKPNNPLRRGENNHDLALELRFTGGRFLSVAVSRSYSRLCEVGLTFLTLCPADRSFPSNIVNKIKLNLLPTFHHSQPPPQHIFQIKYKIPSSLQAVYIGFLKNMLGEGREREESERKE